MIDLQKIKKNKMTGYISLTAIAKEANAKDANTIVVYWMSERATVDFLTAWEKKHNPNFNQQAFEKLRREEVGLNAFMLDSNRWVNLVNAIGITVEGKNSYAHPNIALNFASWLFVDLRLQVFESFNWRANE